jgi:RHS repeat-associated protein
MTTKAIALISSLCVLPVVLGQATPPVYPGSYPAGNKSCAIPNSPYPDYRDCPDCTEVCPDSGADDDGSSGGGSGMPPLGPSPHSGAKPPAGEVETPNTVIGTNHGGALLNTTDLKVPGTLSGVPLRFTRYYNSRDAEGYGDLMGHGRTWTHTFSWRMTVQGGAIRVDFPSGRRLEFTKPFATTYRGLPATGYLPPAGFGERIYNTGDFWHLDQVGAAAHTFERVVLPDSTVIYHPRESVDTRGNKLTYETNAAARITKASDTLGNHIDLTYSQVTLNRKAAVNLHTITSAPAVGWNEVIIPAGQSFRWIQAVSAPNFYFDVSEIEFYKDNGSGGHTKLTGAVYGTDPSFGDNPSFTYQKAFDGSTSTRFKYCRPNHGIAGIDLGSGNTAAVTKIRYFIASTFSGQLAKFTGMKFEGMTEQPETITVLSDVTASTGQSVEFDYGTHLDTSVGQSHAVVEKVLYRDAANTVTDEAVLTWITSQEGTSPSIRRAIEPRSASATPDIAFDYYPGNLAVKGQPAYVLAGDPAAGRIIQVSDPKATAAWIAPDGGTHTVVNTSTNAYRPTSSTDAGGKATAYAWNSGGFLATKTTPAGATAYTRNSRGQILTMARPDGLTVTHTYFATRLLSVKQSAAGLPDRTTTYTRDASGRVTKITYPDTSYEDYTYDTHGLLTSVREKNGTFTVHSYDTTANSPTAGLRLTTTRGLAAATSDPSTGETTAYTWHLPGNTSNSPARLLASVTDPRNRTTAYEYDHAGRVTKTTYPDGSFRQLAYDAFGNKTTEFDGSSLEHWTHDFFRRTLTHTDAALGLTTYDYGLNGSSCTCYGSGGPTLVTSPAGRKTRRTYDLMGRLLTETRGFTTADAALTAREYDTLGRLTKSIGPDGHETTYTHDPAGRVLTQTADPAGLNLTTTRTHSPFGDTLTVKLPGNRTTTTAYDEMGRPVSVKDPLNLETVITYDPAGNRTAVTEASGTPSARTTGFTYDAYDRLTTTTYPDTTTVSQTYHPGGEPDLTTDEMGRQISRDTALETWQDSLGQNWTSFASVTVRDPAGLAHTSKSYGPPMSFTGGTRRSVTPMGRVSESYSDELGRTTLTRTGLVATGSSLTADITDTVMTYDADGFLLTSTTDPTGLNLTTTYTPDGLARVKTAKDPLNRTTEFFYDKRGNRLKTKLPDNREHINTYDALSRLKTAKDPKNQVIEYGYWYETGQTLTLKDAKNQTTTWTYNLRGQLLTKAYPNGDDHAYTYDTLGRMETHTTPKNEVCTYTYDVRDRQTKRDWNSSTPDTETEYFADGMTKSIDNGSTLVSYTYDILGRMDTETQTFTGRPARTVAYDYDADGLRSDLTHPSGKVVDYQWTAKGQLDNLAADGPPPLATYGYDRAGRLDLLTHENGITEDLGYDAASQLQTRLHKLGATTVSGHGYDYDSTSRRTDETFADGTTAARTYGYDNADQVTGATYGGGLTDSYTYDAAANRSTATVAALGGTAITYTANSANQYTSISGMSAPVHDANGNLTSQNGNTYTWDSENRLLSVVPTSPSAGDKSLAYIYDARHRRTIRTVQEWNGSTWGITESTRFIYDGWNVIAEYALTSTTETLIRERTWGTDLSGSLQGAGGVGGLLMVEEITTTTTTAYHFQYDGNGNVTEITDATGASAATYRYDAFGNTLVATGSYAATNRYRFSTKPLDNEVANAPLYYYGYRYYDPVTGRWPSRDPIQERGGVNLYGFVKNDGVNRIDLLGLKDMSDEECIVEIVVGHGTVNAPDGTPRPPQPGTIHEYIAEGGGADCYASGYIGCNVNLINPLWMPQLNEEGPEGLWEADCASISSWIFKAAQSAAREANKMCVEPDCCDTWGIRVKLLTNYTNEWDQANPENGLGPNHPFRLSRKDCVALDALDEIIIIGGRCN